jgi:phage terminase large subunit-like protein
VSQPATYEHSQPADWRHAAADLLDPPEQRTAEWDARVEQWQTRQARPDQLAPTGIDWLIWLILAGRGFGKTRTGAEQCSDWARTMPASRGAIVAQTFTDGRDTMIEGESGLLACIPDQALRGGSREKAWNRSLGELFFANGSRAKIYSSEKPGQLRGPQHHWAWVDEPAKFRDARLGDALDTTWNNLMLGLRLGQQPRVIVTGTPTACQLVKQLVKHRSAHVTRGSTYDNLANLAPNFRAEILARYEGTRIGRQELLGEILDDVEGALWTLTVIDGNRQPMPPESLTRVAVAIDPAGGSEEHNDETGIICAGREGNQGYVLDDRSGRYKPHEWAARAIACYETWKADRIVCERNFGGDMVEHTLRAAGFKGRIVQVTASRGKRQRAEPIAAMYEQGRVHHVGEFPVLEEQMTMWVPDSGTSPDRMDALVWALTDLLEGQAAAGFLAALVAGQQPQQPQGGRHAWSPNPEPSGQA